MKILIYVNEELKMTCYNEFIALNNVVILRRKYGEDAVKVVREK